MYKKQPITTTSIVANESVEGEPIELKVERIVNNGEPISDGAPIVYTERAEGVKPEHDIRTDRFEIALGATDAISKTHTGKRQERIDALNELRESQKKKEDGAEHTDNSGTSN